jgi:hypothetical protein
MSSIHADNKLRFEKLEDKVSTVLMDVAIIKATTTDVKKDLYGNGTPGLKTRLTQIEERVNTIDSCADTANTTALLAKAKVDNLEASIGKYLGMLIGGNFILIAIFALIVNWDKIKPIFHIS